MSNNPPHKEPLALGHDGESIEDLPIYGLKNAENPSLFHPRTWLFADESQNRVRRALLAVSIIVVLIVVGLFAIDQFEPGLASFIVSLEITGVIGVLAAMPPFRWRFDRWTFPGHRYDQRSAQNRSAKKLKRMYVDEPGADIQSPDDLFLLYPQHRRFLKGERRVLHKSNFAGEVQFVYSFVLPACTVGIIFFFLLGWQVVISFVDEIVGESLAVPTWLQVVGIMVGVVLFSPLYLLFGFIWRAIRSDLQFRHLRRDGVILFGSAVTHTYPTPAPGKNSHTLYTFQMRFTTPDERVLNVEARIPDHILKPRRFPQVGTPIAVLYLNDQHFKLL